MCYCLLSGLMLFCALQGRGCYERRRGKTEDVLFFMWLQCVASMYCQWMYVSVYVFVIALCLQGIGPRGPDSRPQRHAEPTFTKWKRFGAMWYREIIVNVVMFVSICWSSICWCCLCLCQFVDQLFVDVVCVCVNSRHCTLKGMKLACGRLLQGRRRSWSSLQNIVEDPCLVCVCLVLLFGCDCVIHSV